MKPDEEVTVTSRTWTLMVAGLMALGITNLLLLGGLATVVLWVSKNHSQTQDNATAVQELCGQGTTLRDVVIGGIAVVYAELQDPNVPEATHVADRMFLARFRSDLHDVDFLLNNPRSACHQAAP